MLFTLPIPWSWQGPQCPTQLPWVNSLDTPVVVSLTRVVMQNCDHWSSVPSPRINTCLAISWALLPLHLAGLSVFSAVPNPALCVNSSNLLLLSLLCPLLEESLCPRTILTPSRHYNQLEFTIYQRFHPLFQADYPPSLWLTPPKYLLDQHQAFVGFFWWSARQKWFGKCPICSYTKLWEWTWSQSFWSIVRFCSRMDISTKNWCCKISYCFIDQD